MMFRTLLALSLMITAPQVLAVDLLDIYRQARINDARYAAAKAHYRAMQERVPQARAGLPPDLHSGATRYRNHLGLQLHLRAPRSGRHNYNAHSTVGSAIRRPYWRQ